MADDYRKVTVRINAKDDAALRLWAHRTGEPYNKVVRRVIKEACDEFRSAFVAGTLPGGPDA